MMIGKVTWFNPLKGFGFIESRNEKYFVFFKFINNPGYKKLTKGDEVKFTPVNNEGKPQARNVSIIQRGKYA